MVVTRHLCVRAKLDPELTEKRREIEDEDQTPGADNDCEFRTQRRHTSRHPVE